MKKMILALVLLVSANLAFASSTDPEHLYDTSVHCRAVGSNDLFKSVSMTLRESDGGLRLVRNSVSVSPGSNQKMFSVFEDQPNVTSSSSDLEVLSGSEVDRAALRISKVNATLWQGVVQLWKAYDTVNGVKLNVTCTTEIIHRNSEPVLNP